MIKFSIFNKSYSIIDNDIESICLFGSVARGEADRFSDLDIFILINDCSEEEFIKKKVDYAAQLELPVSWISLYQVSSAISMYEYGSYFLWHLKQEGKILFSRTGKLEQIFNDLPDYSRAKEDLLEYHTICKDICHSISLDDKTLLYELYILASLIRNTCITISYQHKKIVFGRISPVQYCLEILGNEFPFTLKEYEQIYMFRIAYSRPKDIIQLPKIGREEVLNWVKKVEKLIAIGLREMNIDVK